MARTGGRDDKLELLRRLPWAGGAGDDDLRWLARVADGFSRPGGALVARRATPSRWAYVVLAGTVEAEGTRHGPGAVLLPDVDLLAVDDVEVLAFPRTEEPGLHRRFPGSAPVATRPRPHCPVAQRAARLVAARPA